MTKVYLDPETRSKLHDLVQSLELCDESGRTLGYFLPAQFDPAQYQSLDPNITEQELDQREKEQKRFTTAEVLAHLRAL
jgi:hypothetical protein